MLKYLGNVFDELNYDLHDCITCAPGCGISKIPELVLSCDKRPDLIILNFGINNLLSQAYSIQNCMYLYDKVRTVIMQRYPKTCVAFTSVSYIADDKFQHADISNEINPLVSKLNLCLESYCSEKANTFFIDLRPDLRTNDDHLIDRKNLGKDGLHYSNHGIQVVAQSLIREVDVIMAEFLSKTDVTCCQPFCFDTENTESWPELPKPSVSNRIHPAAFPGEQYRTVTVSNARESEHITKQVKPAQSEPKFEESNKKGQQTNHTNKIRRTTKQTKQKSTSHTDVRTRKPVMTYKTTKTRKASNAQKTSDVFLIETSNMYTILNVEATLDDIITQQPMNFPTCAVRKNQKRKPLKLFIKKKYTKLECAARGSCQMKSMSNQQCAKREYYYENPHRNSPFETLMWTKAGFIQTAHCDETISTFDAQTAFDMIKIKQHDTKDISRELEQHLCQMLLLSGDVETNPGPRMKKRSAERKTRLRKLKRVQETEDERKIRLEKDKTTTAKKRTEECPENKRMRLSEVSQHMSKLRSQESPEKKQMRLSRDVKQKSKMRSQESQEIKQRRLSKDAKQKSKLRSQENPEERQRRLSTDAKQKSKLRLQESPENNQRRLMLTRRTMQNLRHERMNVVNLPDETVNVFLSKVRRAADFVCCCCNRLMYESGVVLFNENKYEKVLMRKINKFRMASVDNKEWICRNCHLNLQRKKMPPQAKCNGLSLCKIPDELKHLNALEVRLISRRIPFMKLVSLPRGKQLGIQGPAVNVPTDLDTVCEQFPRLPNECQIISLKLKRKLEYRKAYMHDYIHPWKVIKGLQWLKQNNPLYKDVIINSNWMQDSEECDPELWHAMTNRTPNDDDAEIASDDSFVSNSALRELNDGMESASSNEVMQCGDDTTAVARALRQLKTRAFEKGYSIHNVAADSDCLFHAMCHELKKLDLYDGNATDLRSKVAQFMKENPKCDNNYEYKHFWTGRIEQHNSLNADTEKPTDEDRAIEAIENEEIRIEKRWALYLRRLEHEKQWGDHLVLKGLAEQFQVNIYIISSETSNIFIHEPFFANSVGDTHIGLVLQYHFVALDDNKDISQSTVNSCDANSEEQLNEQHEAEDKAALERSVELCGLPYESGLFSKDPDWCNKIISCAPGEKQKPIPLLSDQHFEQLSNPEKFPDGQNGLLSDREKTIHPRRYFNQRLLDVDGRFAKSTDYLLSAQYATESQQIHGNINHYVLRRAKARSTEGKKITAKDVKNTNYLHHLVRSDQAYKLFKNVRGSPAYWQSLFYDILAMMSQLGTPTWFFTLSAADMQWPDMIQTIARQSGVSLNDDDVRNMSYAERCNWLRLNPVTAVRHFHYRLETFMKHAIMSNAKPLGEVVDYAIRIEFQARGSPHAHTLLWVKDAPQLNVQTDDEVCQFVQDHISCQIPEEDNEKELILKLQNHSHSSYCRKKGSCRFKYPKPPSERVIIAKEPEDDNSIELKLHAKNVMTKMLKAITETENLEAYSTQQLIAAIDVSVDG